MWKDAWIVVIVYSREASGVSRGDVWLVVMFRQSLDERLSLFFSSRSAKAFPTLYEPECSISSRPFVLVVVA